MTRTVKRVDLALELTRRFTISRGSTETLEASILRVEDDGVTGWGQAVASPSVTGETQDDARRALDRLDPEALDPSDVPGTLEGLDAAGPAARAAVDLALYDLRGRQQETPSHRLLGLSDGMAASAVTVTLTEPDAAAEQARAWLGRGYTRLKVKVGEAAGVLDLVDAVRDAIPDTVRPPMPDPEIWIDANEALDLDAATALLPELADRGVALVEQPLPRDALDETRQLAEDSSLPIVLDEAICSPGDVERLADWRGPVGVNVKVQKVGGLHAAHRCIETAREHGLSVLVGCSIETGLGIGAGACLAGAADQVDLDGNLFLARDPFPLPRPMPGHVGTPEGAGLGVHPDPRFDTLTL